jgi:hypothetical protein
VATGSGSVQFVMMALVRAPVRTFGPEGAGLVALRRERARHAVSAAHSRAFPGAR